MDPEPRFDTNTVPPNVEVVRKTSDEYFKSLSGDVKFDVMFIDGLHSASQTFKDIWNCLIHSHEESVFLIDDVIPDDDLSSIASQEASIAAKMEKGIKSRRWHGDVWKVLPVLNSVFPNLQITLVHRPGKTASLNEDNPQALVWWKAFKSPTAGELELGQREILRLEGQKYSQARKDWPELFNVVPESVAFERMQQHFSVR